MILKSGKDERQEEKVDKALCSYVRTDDTSFDRNLEGNFSPTNGVPEKPCRLCTLSTAFQFIEWLRGQCDQ